MAVVEEMAEFVARASVGSLSPAGRIQLKVRILDALGCAIGALDADPVRRVRRFVTDFPLDGPCTVIRGRAKRTGSRSLVEWCARPLPRFQ
jgi:2-methylcitrate dehydratase